MPSVVLRLFPPIKKRPGQKTDRDDRNLGFGMERKGAEKRSGGLMIRYTTATMGSGGVRASLSFSKPRYSLAFFSTIPRETRF